MSNAGHVKIPGIKVGCANAQCGNPDVWANLSQNRFNSQGKPNSCFNKWFRKCKLCNTIQTDDTPPSPAAAGSGNSMVGVPVQQQAMFQQSAEQGQDQGRGGGRVLGVANGSGGSGSGNGGDPQCQQSNTIAFTSQARNVPDIFTVAQKQDQILEGIKSLRGEVETIHTFLLNRVGEIPGVPPFNAAKRPRVEPIAKPLYPPSAPKPALIPPPSTLVS
jgi:hypothetical protein